ncbi:MAG: hypothetical protein QM784_12700 [Polyangiaceae bacterium]
MPNRALRLFVLSVLSVLCTWLGTARYAIASPEAHILRIDPRAAQENGSPVLTSIIEVVENRRVSEVVLPCANLSGGAQLSCMSEALDKTPLYTAFPFPAQNAIFTVRVDGGDVLAKYVSHSRWGESRAGNPEWAPRGSSSSMPTLGWEAPSRTRKRSRASSFPRWDRTTS